MDLNAHVRSLSTIKLLVVLALTGCALQSPPSPGDLRQQALPNVTPSPQWAAPGGAAGAVGNDWLSRFDDATLDALVREAISYNANLRAASARVAQAAAYLSAADAALYPQVNLLGRGGGKLSDSSGLSGIGLYANWELDLWGRVRAGEAFSRAQFESAELDADYARQSLAALVAKGWFIATEARLQKAQAADMQRASEQLASLARDRLRVGNGDEFDVALAQANVESFRDAEQTFDLAYTQALRSLETLVGRYPAAALAAPERLAALPGGIPMGLPSELLERRPDVVAAERRVASAFYRVEEAKAARLPRITLTASVTTISSELFVLKNRDDPVWSLGAGLLQPIFLGGLLQAQVEARTAEQVAAVADYGRVGAKVFAEVENALASSFSLAQREDILQRTVRENTRALDLALVRYRVGSGDQRGVQQQQLALYATRVTLLRIQTERLVQRVNLHLALGGGFDARQAATVRAGG